MDMDMVIVMVMMATMGEGGWCAEKRFDANSAWNYIGFETAASSDLHSSKQIRNPAYLPELYV